MFLMLKSTEANIKSGFAAYDNKIGCFRKGQLVVLLTEHKDRVLEHFKTATSAHGTKIYEVVPPETTEEALLAQEAYILRDMKLTAVKNDAVVVAILDENTRVRYDRVRQEHANIVWSVDSALKHTSIKDRNSHPDFN